MWNLADYLILRLASDFNNLRLFNGDFKSVFKTKKTICIFHQLSNIKSLFFISFARSILWRTQNITHFLSTNWMFTIWILFCDWVHSDCDMCEYWILKKPRVSQSAQSVPTAHSALPVVTRQRIESDGLKRRRLTLQCPGTKQLCLCALLCFLDLKDP